MLTCGSTGWDDGSVETGLGNNINLDGWVTSRVVDCSGVNFDDRHGCGLGQHMIESSASAKNRAAEYCRSVLQLLLNADRVDNGR